MSLSRRPREISSCAASPRRATIADIRSIETLQRPIVVPASWVARGTQPGDQRVSQRRRPSAHVHELIAACLAVQGHQHPR